MWKGWHLLLAVVLSLFKRRKSKSSARSAHTARRVLAQAQGQGQKQLPLKPKWTESASIHVRPQPAPTHPCSTLPCNPLCAGNRSIECAVRLMQGLQALSPLLAWCSQWEFPARSRVEVSQCFPVGEEHLWSWDGNKTKQIGDCNSLWVLHFLNHLSGALPFSLSPQVPFFPLAGTSFALYRVLGRSSGSAPHQGYWWSFSNFGDPGLQWLCPSADPEHPSPRCESLSWVPQSILPAIAKVVSSIIP